MKDRLQQKHTPCTPAKRAKNNNFSRLVIIIVLSMFILWVIWSFYKQYRVSHRFETVNENSISTELSHDERYLLEENLSFSTFANTPLNYEDIIKKLKKKTTPIVMESVPQAREPEVVIVSGISETHPKETPKKETVQKVFKNDYFVQVGAINGKPDKVFLTKMKEHNFKFLLKSSPIDENYKKILIGPYHDRATARLSLMKIRKVINKSAFIVKF